MHKNTNTENFEHQDLACPECSAPMELVWSSSFRLKSGARKPLYRCYKWPECSGTHWAHPNGAPMGIPANKETRVLRQKVHAELNEIFPWKKKRAREATYTWLESHGFGHIGSMSADDCRKVLEILRKK